MFVQLRKYYEDLKTSLMFASQNLNTIKYSNNKIIIFR